VSFPFCSHGSVATAYRQCSRLSQPASISVSTCPKQLSYSQALCSGLRCRACFLHWISVLDFPSLLLVSRHRCLDLLQAFAAHGSQSSISRAGALSCRCPSLTRRLLGSVPCLILASVGGYCMCTSSIRRIVCKALKALSTFHLCVNTCRWKSVMFLSHWIKGSSSSHSPRASLVVSLSRALGV
jgi:hypothetical protein